MNARNLFIKNGLSTPDCPYVLIGSHDPEDGMDGAVAHVFGHDEEGASKLARSILDQLSVAGGGESGVLEVNEYQLMGGSSGDVVDLRIQRRRLEDGSSKWRIIGGRFILNPQGEWEERGLFDHFVGVILDDKKHCYFDTVEEALRCWQTAVMRSVYDKPGRKLPGDEAQADKIDDLAFLKEIQERLTAGVDKRDPTQVEYAREMIRDWIDELEEAGGGPPLPVEEVEERPSVEVVRDILLLVHEQEVDLEFLDSLAADDLEQVQKWAALEHLGASDNDVERVAMPHCLATYFRLTSGG